VKALANKRTLNSDFISEQEAYQLIMWEGSKSYLTRNVSKDNKDRLFKPYKDLCERISLIIKELNPKYKFPHSMASTILEMAHSQKFFMQNLPALTDFPKEHGRQKNHPLYRITIILFFGFEFEVFIIFSIKSLIVIVF
jgi:hypothetical protein